MKIQAKVLSSKVQQYFFITCMLKTLINLNDNRKLQHTRPQVWGHPLAVDWAEPEVEVDEDVMAQVKILYVRNLMLQTTEEQLEKVILSTINLILTIKI